MSTPATVLSGKKSFAGAKFYRHDFSGQDLQGADFRGTTLVECNFAGADLTLANLQGANCFGSDFTNAKVTRTNFRDACLALTKFRVRDAFGVTLTLTCDAFDETEVDEKLWYSWLVLATLMKPPSEEERSKLIALIGAERYARYRSHFRNREM